MEKETLFKLIIDGLKLDVCKYWKNWGKKEKQEWILSLLVSGSDYGGEIERKRTGFCFNCYFNECDRCLKINEQNTKCLCKHQKGIQ